MKEKKRILQNISSNWAIILIKGTAGLLIIPFVISRVGWSEYGVWILVTQVLAYPTILNNGLGHSITRFAAYYRDDVLQVNRFVSSSFWLLSVGALLVFVLSGIAFFLIPIIFPSIPPESLHDAKVVCLLVGLTLGFKFVQSNYSGALKGYQHYVYFNLATAIGVLLRVGFIVVGLNIWPNIIALQAAVAAASLCELFFQAYWAYRLIPGLSISFGFIDWSAARELFDYAKHAVARTFGEVIMLGAMPVLIGIWGVPTDVAIYDLANKLPRYVSNLITGVQTVFLPAFTSLFAKENTRRIRLFIEKGTRMGFLVTMLFCIPMFVFADSLLTIWLQNDVPEITALIMKIMIIQIVAGGIFHIWIAALVAHGVLHQLSVAAVVTMITAIGSTVICYKYFHLPVAVAPAIGLCIAVFLKSALWLPVFSLRKLKINGGEYFREALAKPILASIVAVVITVVFHHLFQGSGRFEVLMEYFIISILVFVCLALIAARTEAMDFLKLIQDRIRSIKTRKS